MMASSAVRLPVPHRQPAPTRRVCGRGKAPQRRARRALTTLIPRAQGLKPQAATGNDELLAWLEKNGAGEQKAKIASLEVDGAPLDIAVASSDLAAGDVALSIPERLCVTLDRVFEDETVAEVLTTDKLSELACLTLYLMYEKKNGPSSFWYEYIKELDRERGRGQLGVPSPLLWKQEEVEELLAGSPVVEDVAARRASIEKEYEELDTVWFMAGSLFRDYPYDIPTEAFSRELFLQAFAAVQSCVVHLQGVPPSKRFALVPMGPPLTVYSSTCKSMLGFNPVTRAVELRVDRPFREGEPLQAWCGPQPNSRLLLNYGLVNDENPYDKMQITASVRQEDPLFSAKRAKLQMMDMTSRYAFNLTAAAPLPDRLLPFLRFAYLTDASEVQRLTLDDLQRPVSAANEAASTSLLAAHLRSRIAKYRTTIEEDTRTIEDASASAKAKVAARLLRIEKGILLAALEQLTAVMPGEGGDAGPPPELHPKLS